MAKTKKPFFKTEAEFDAFKAKQRLELKKEMLAKTKGNPRVTLLTAGQVKTEWNISQEMLDAEKEKLGAKAAARKLRNEREREASKEKSLSTIIKEFGDVTS